MKHCDKCGADIRGSHKLCPLCQGILTGTDEADVFPKVPLISEKFKFFFQIVLVSLVGVCVAAVGVNILLPQTGAWSVFAVVGAIFSWISLRIAIKRRNNIPKNIVMQVVIVSLAVVLFDILTGWHGWSIEYVFPIVCVCAMIALGVLSKVLKMPNEDYIVFIIADIFFGIIPFVFLLCGIVSMRTPSIICVGCSVLSFAALLIFNGNGIRVELEKKFHM